MRNKHIPNALIILPAYNVAGIIRKTLTDILKVIPSQASVVVVDDGSTDEIQNQLNGFNIVLLQHHRNMGKGAALKTGFRYGIAHSFSHAIVLDADSQHDPNQIPDFLDAPGYDLVLGTRDISLKSMSLDRYLSNKISSLILSLILRRRFRDSQCGFRLINLGHLKKLSLQSDHYEMESELLIKFARSSARIRQIPVRTISSNGTSHIRRGRDSMRFLNMLWKTLIYGS